jgi:hypothetical protein
MPSIGQHLRRTVHDVDSLAAPLDLEHRARLELADVHFYRRAHGFCAGAGFPGSQERYGDERNAHRAGRDCGDGQEMAPARIDFFGHPALSSASARCRACCNTQQRIIAKMG